MPLRSIAAAICFSAALIALPPRATAAKHPPETREERRRARLLSHLKRLQQPEAWSISRKLFSVDPDRQLRGMAMCPHSESEWPWYLSTGNLQDYTFRMDFIPINMDMDKEEEALLVIQTDPGEVNYISFCVLDDEKRGRTPLASYSDLSKDRPVTYQLTDITNDGENEIVLYSLDGTPGEYSESVRIIKLNRARRFELVWFARLRDHLVWPTKQMNGDRPRTVTRSERLWAKMRLWFNGPDRPPLIVLSGEREYKKITSYHSRAKQVRQNSVEKIPFVEYWRWDKDLFHFVRVPGLP